MKEYIIWISILCGCIFNSIAAQNGINTITKLGEFGAIFTESEWYNDTLYVAGTSFKQLKEVKLAKLKLLHAAKAAFP